MMKKIIGIGVCMLLMSVLIPLTSAEQITVTTVDSTSLGMSKTIFIGRFTVMSHKVPLANKNIVGWIIGNGEIHRYRGALPDATGDIQGIISSPFVFLVFDTNPFY
jgi:hypothetical protein